MSDYAPGTRLEPTMVNITFANGQVIDHVGVGYHLKLPSGRVIEGGYTWHSPRGGYAQAPPDRITTLQEIMNELLQAAAASEGL